jgi:exopolysaccharide production protein ExoQ
MSEPAGVLPWADGLRSRGIASSASGRTRQSFYALPSFDWDGVFAFVLFAPMLFILQFGSFGALIFSLATVICAMARGHGLIRLLRTRWYLLVFPAYVILSTLWSDAPLETLKHSAEFALTVLAALLLASAHNKRSVLLGIFAAFALYTAVSLIVGTQVDVGNNGARALSGLNDSKNEQADIAATGFVISASLFLMGLRMRSLLLCLATAAAGAVELYAAVAALSAGAVAATAVALAVLAVLVVLCRAGRTTRAAVVGVVGAGAAALTAIFVLFTSDVLDWLATMFGKDNTLTGRTYLWARARDLIVEHPLLGRGFAAFWQQGNLDAEGLWQFGGITDRQGFNFHNTSYDALVSLGWVGLVIFGFTLAAGTTVLARSYVRTPSLLACFWLSMAVYMLIRLPVECIGLNEFYFSTVLLFAMLGAGAQTGRVGGGQRHFTHADMMLLQGIDAASVPSSLGTFTPRPAGTIRSPDR